MNEYIFYTTEGDTIAPNENYEVDNCQVLGRVTDVNPEKALNTLISDNSWILEAGFDTSKFLVKQILTSKQREDILLLLNHLTLTEQNLNEGGNADFSSIIQSLKGI